MDCYHGHGDPTHWTFPKRLSGGKLRFPPEAIAQRVEGIVIAQCHVPENGVLKDCRILKPLPPMDAAVLDFLHRGRYSPVTHKGKPLAMRYTFIIRFKPPEKETVAPRP